MLKNKTSVIYHKMEYCVLRTIRDCLRKRDWYDNIDKCITRLYETYGRFMRYRRSYLLTRLLCSNDVKSYDMLFTLIKSLRVTTISPIVILYALNYRVSIPEFRLLCDKCDQTALSRPLMNIWFNSMTLLDNMVCNHVNISYIKVLLEYNVLRRVNITLYGQNSLSLAIRYDNINALDLMLRNINSGVTIYNDILGYTLYDCALYHNNINAIELLSLYKIPLPDNGIVIYQNGIAIEIATRLQLSVYFGQSDNYIYFLGRGDNVYKSVHINGPFSLMSIAANYNQPMLTHVKLSLNAWTYNTRRYFSIKFNRIANVILHLHKYIDRDKHICATQHCMCVFAFLQPELLLIIISYIKRF